MIFSKLKKKKLSYVDISNIKSILMIYLCIFSYINHIPKIKYITVTNILDNRYIRYYCIFETLVIYISDIPKRKYLIY